MSAIKLRTENEQYNTVSTTVESISSNVVGVEDTSQLRVDYVLFRDGEPTDIRINSINPGNSVNLSASISSFNYSVGDEIIFSKESIKDTPLFNEEIDQNFFNLNRHKLDADGSISATENFIFEKDILCNGSITVDGNISNISGQIQTGSVDIQTTLNVGTSATFGSDIQLNNNPSIILSGTDTLTIGTSTNDIGIPGNLSVAGTLTADLNGSASGYSGTTDGVNEGNINLYFTTSRVDNHLSGINGVEYSNGTISHADTSSESSSVNSGRAYIQTVELDAYGHVINLETSSETVVDTNDIDYISIVSTSGTSLNFTGVGNAYSSSVNLSSVIDSRLSGGTGVNYSSGTISIGQSVEPTSDVEFNSVEVGGNAPLSNFSVDTETISFTAGEISSKSFEFYDFTAPGTNLSFNSFVVVRPPTDTNDYPDTLFSGAHVVDINGSPQIRLIIHNQSTNQDWPATAGDRQFAFLIIN